MADTALQKHLASDQITGLYLAIAGGSLCRAVEALRDYCDARGEDRNHLFEGLVGARSALRGLFRQWKASAISCEYRLGGYLSFGSAPFYSSFWLMSPPPKDGAHTRTVFGTQRHSRTHS